MDLGIIADDVTGATDLASVIRREGLSVVQTFGIPQTPPPAADAVVVSLKIRTVTAGDATQAARTAARYLLNQGAARIYFKYCSTFDSRPDGNIGPVIDALLSELQSPLTVACPSYPALGRTVYLGHLFVGDDLLSESPMRHHPLTPMTDANLVRVLARQSSSRIGLISLADVEAGTSRVRARFDALAAAGCRAAIVDAVFDGHLDTVAAACCDLRLITGGAALAGALARARSRTIAELKTEDPGSRTNDQGPRTFSSAVAILSGSGSAATFEQVQRLKAHLPSHAIDPVSLARDGSKLSETVDWACRQATSGHVFIYSTASPDAVQDAQRTLGRAQAATVLEKAFGTLARRLYDCGVRTFVIAGGETSGAVLEAMDIKMLGFGDEIEPGVPWTYSVEPAGLRLALKSGNFGGPDFFLRALRMNT